MKRRRIDMPKLLSAVAATLMSGCSQNYDDLYSYIDQAKSNSVGSVTPIPQFKPYESFAYSAADLRDPFVANVEADQKGGEGDGLTPDSDRPDNHWKPSHSIHCEWSASWNRMTAYGD